MRDVSLASLLATGQTDGDKGAAAIHVSCDASDGNRLENRRSDINALHCYGVSQTYPSLAATAALRSSQRSHAEGATTRAAI